MEGQGWDYLWKIKIYWVDTSSIREATGDDPFCVSISCIVALLAAISHFVHWRMVCMHTHEAEWHYP